MYATVVAPQFCAKKTLSLNPNPCSCRLDIFFSMTKWRMKGQWLLHFFDINENSAAKDHSKSEKMMHESNWQHQIIIWGRRKTVIKVQMSPKLFSFSKKTLRPWHLTYQAQNNALDTSFSHSIEHLCFHIKICHYILALFPTKENTWPCRFFAYHLSA